LNISYNSKEDLLSRKRDDKEEGPRKLLSAAQNEQHLEDLKANLLKYNLLCGTGDTDNKPEEHASGKDDRLDNSQVVQGFIIKKVENILRSGNLQDKIDLYYSINNNLQDVLTSVLEYDNKCKKKDEQLSLCIHTWLII
jgi:hypothetical protein